MADANHHSDCACIVCKAQPKPAQEELESDPWEDLEEWQQPIMKDWDEVAEQLNIQTKVCDVEWGSTQNDHIFIDGEEWLVLDDDEATERAEERIKEGLWSFNTSWLAKSTDFPEKVFKVLQEDCEDSRENIETLIEATCGLEDFVNSTIEAYGRGSFISSYDNEEVEVSVDGVYHYFYRLE